MTHKADKEPLAGLGEFGLRANPMAAAGATASTGEATTPISVRLCLGLGVWSDRNTL